jgi:homocysteine S-methyltransferase
MTTLPERLERGEVIILDGGMGTELEKRGVPMDSTVWSGAAVLSHPDYVREIHEDYIRAGADIIITNTFSMARHALEQTDMAGQFRELNTRAVKLAQEAQDNVAGRPVFIAGSISTFEAHNDSRYRPLGEQAQASYREQAEVLAEAGVDLLMLEMMQDIEQATYAVQAAVATGLPVSVGFSCAQGADGRLLSLDHRHHFSSVLEAILPLNGSIMSIMHTLTEDVTPALQLLKGQWSGWLGAYAHSGDFIMPNWQFIDMISPEDYAVEAKKWIDMGVQLVGGCCGIGPEHIRVLKDQLPAHISR